jgi:hypothetical protein
MHYNVNENTLIEEISRVQTSGLLSSHKEVEANYCKDLGDDNSSTQDKSPHPLISVSITRFKKGTST